MIRLRAARLWIIGLIAGLVAAATPGATESAVANGDTRTIHLYHAHSHESINATFKVDGQYDPAVLAELNHFLRDWRNDDQISMDPRLFDVVWEVYRESGSQQPIEVLSAYRSPATNAMLRRRTHGVAEHSQHILGRAMDQHYMDVPMSRIRELGMKLQRGGVGFYPTSGTPFVHLDVGGVRHWPRMSYDQLVRLFPDGKTVHIPSNGVPLPGYEEARAELAARGDDSYPSLGEVKSKGFFAWLFGGGGDEEEDNEQAGVRGARSAPQRVASAAPMATSAPASYGKNDGGSFFSNLFSSSQPAAPSPSAAAQVAPQPRLATAQPAAQPVSDAKHRLAEAMQAQFAAHAADAVPPGTATLPVRDTALDGAPASAPLPPRRPVELAALGPDTPLPPLRPTGFTRDPHDAAPSPGTPPSAAAKLDPIAAVLAGNVHVARLPDVITQGVQGRMKTGTLVLGYASQADAAVAPRGPTAVSVPLPAVRPPDLVSAHLDRSNFRNLTRPSTLDRTGGRTALGTVLPPIRAAARTDYGALVPVVSARPSSFASGGGDLPTARFASP